MKNLLTGAAQSVTDTNERVRKIFENRPLEAPVQKERQNRPRKTFAKAADDEEKTQRSEAPEADTSEEEVAELDASESTDGNQTDDDTEEE